MKMKKILILIILTILLTSCFGAEPIECIDYKGDKKCIRYLDGEEIIWK
jgi:lipoprotein